MPKISIIIPVYKVEKYIERCARSLFEQTLDDIEYLFIDDCSPDKSIEVLKDILDEYPHRKSQTIIHRMERNKGQAAVRYWGVKNATGDYLIHCDSDDWVELDMYRSLYEEAILTNADIVICDYYESDGIVNRLKHYDYSEDKECLINDLLFLRGSWALWNKLIRRNLYNNIKFPLFNMGEDMSIVFQLIQKSSKIVAINKPLYYYYYNTESISNQKSIKNSIQRFIQACENTKIVEESIGNNPIFKVGLLNLKEINRNLLLGGLDSKEACELWISRYPNLTRKLLLSKGIDFKQKIRAVHYEVQIKLRNLYSIFKNFFCS